MHYLDTSATAKLLVAEAESDALSDFLRRTGGLLMTSRVGIIELRRVGRKSGAGADRADALAATLVIAEVDQTLEHQAVHVDPSLRTLDAIHLATALAAGDALDGFVCYDTRLARAAGDVGLRVLSPGA